MNKEVNMNQQYSHIFVHWKKVADTDAMSTTFPWLYGVYVHRHSQPFVNTSSLRMVRQMRNTRLVFWVSTSASSTSASVFKIK